MFIGAFVSKPGTACARYCARHFFFKAPFLLQNYLVKYRYRRTSEKLVQVYVLRVLHFRCNSCGFFLRKPSVVANSLCIVSSAERSALFRTQCSRGRAFLRRIDRCVYECFYCSVRVASERGLTTKAQRTHSVAEAFVHAPLLLWSPDQLKLQLMTPISCFSMALVSVYNLL